MPSASWLNGWVSNDVVTTAEFKKGVGTIFNTILGAPAANVDTGAIIPAGYADLEITVQARGDTAAALVNLLMRVNGVSTGSYYYEELRGTAAAAAASEGLAQTSAFVGTIAAASSAAASFAGIATITIPNYASTTFKRYWTAEWSSSTDGTTGSIRTGQTGGFFDSTAAITQLTFLPSAGNFVAGTRVTVRVKGA